MREITYPRERISKNQALVAKSVQAKLAVEKLPAVDLIDSRRERRAAMKERIKYIAGYQVAPISGVTHYAEVKEIKPHKDTGKYIVFFKGPAKEIPKIPVKDASKAPQGPVYTKLERLLSCKYFDEAITS
jgi:hypothetical protein